MDSKVKHYIESQPQNRQGILTDIHLIIVQEDKTVVPIVEPMMAKEMIVYKGKGFMKYGLASVKNYMSLHVMPIYGSKILFTKYQKGCINFTTEDEMPLEIVRQLFADCSKIDLLKIREDYLKEKKAKQKK